VQVEKAGNTASRKAPLKQSLNGASSNWKCSILAAHLLEKRTASPSFRVGTSTGLKLFAETVFVAVRDASGNGFGKHDHGSLCGHPQQPVP
jgi:hypothetical protein